MGEDRPQFNPVVMPLMGVHGIGASAGTGKTHAITTLYLRYLLETDCRVEQILVTTYTEAATAELKDRLRHRLHEAQLALRCENVAAARDLADAKRVDATMVDVLEQAGAWHPESARQVATRLDEAILEFDRAPIFTIHGFCNRVLQEMVFETGSRFDLELVTSQDALLEEAVADFAAREWAGEKSALAQQLPLDEKLWKAMRSVVRLAVDNPGLGIVPVTTCEEVETPSPLLGAFNAKVGLLAAQWKEGGEQASNLVRHAFEQGWLQRNRFRIEWIETSLTFIRELIVNRSPLVFELDDDGEVEAYQQRLTRTYLAKSTNKPHQRHTPQHPIFDTMDELVALAKQFHAQRAEVTGRVLSRVLSKVGLIAREHVARRKRETGMMSFSDLLHGVDTALQGPQADLLLASLRTQYRVVLIDEFQDTDPVQCRIFQRAFQEAADADVEPLRAFVTIGDPKQSIYRFRGADIHSYLRATDQTPQDHRHSMGTNWRSDRSLVDAVQAVFAAAPDPFMNERIPLPAVSAHHSDRFTDGPALAFHFVERDVDANPDRAVAKDSALRRIVSQVVGDIVAQLNRRPTIQTSENQARPLTPGDLAVLCRTGKQLRLIQRGLAQRGVPSVLQTDESIFDTPEATATLQLLRAVVEPGQRRWICAALQTPLFGFDADQLEDLRTHDSELARYGESFHRWNATWRQSGFASMWKQFFDEMEILPRLATLMTGERLATNYLHLGEVIHRHAVEAHAGLQQTLRWLERSVAEPQHRQDDATQLRLETDSAALQLCTIHKSKGLEYPVVYCPTLWDAYGGPQDPIVMARLDGRGVALPVPEIDVGSPLLDARLEWNKQELEAEDRRLLYVALTRAKHQCHVYWAVATSAIDTAMGQLIFGSGNGEDDTKAPTTDAEAIDRMRKWIEGFRQPRLELQVAPAVVTAAATDRFRPIHQDPKPLAARPVRRASLPQLVQTSYTMLARGLEGTAGFDAADLDDNSATRVIAEACPVTNTPAPATAAPGASALVPLGEMPGGRKVGDLVHRVLEETLRKGAIYRADWTRARATVGDHLDVHLPRVQLDVGWRDPLAAAMARCLTGPISLGGAECRLAEVDPSRLTCEFHFVLKAGGERTAMKTAGIADALSLSSNHDVQNYAKRAQRMQYRELYGFLEGFIDLVFEHDGRWYLADYKTNRLGATSGDYYSGQLAAAMHDHDYVLQYHLYALALDRVLRQRVAGYDYERHFGGAVYLFLRGLDSAGLDSKRGVYFDRPDAAVIESLGAVLVGKDRS